jgi:hypothetical protein
MSFLTAVSGGRIIFSMLEHNARSQMLVRSNFSMRENADSDIATILLLKWKAQCVSSREVEHAVSEFVKLNAKSKHVC